VISARAAVQLYAVLRDYVPMDRLPNLLYDLQQRVAGNQSYRDTIAAMVKLWEIEDDKKRKGDGP
jgi:hypothetical protein